MSTEPQDPQASADEPENTPATNNAGPETGAPAAGDSAVTPAEQEAAATESSEVTDQPSAAAEATESAPAAEPPSAASEATESAPAADPPSAASEAIMEEATQAPARPPQSAKAHIFRYF